jgi:hypothetical protein
MAENPQQETGVFSGLPQINLILILEKNSILKQFTGLFIPAHPGAGCLDV